MLWRSCVQLRSRGITPTIIAGGAAALAQPPPHVLVSHGDLRTAAEQVVALARGESWSDRSQ
jgi:hypothetical protein